MFHIIWVLIVGGVIGLIAGSLTKKSVPAGWWGNVAAGLSGSLLGEKLFPNWGPQVAGMSIVPSILGAVILVIIASWFLQSMNK